MFEKVSFVYTKFNFLFPPLPDIAMYAQLKIRLLENPESKEILTPHFFRESWESLRQYVYAIAFFLIVGLLLLYISKSEGILSGIAAFFVFGSAFIFVCSFVPSFINFVNFAKKRRAYYKKLKYTMMHSNSYEGFVETMSRIKWSLL